MDDMLANLTLLLISLAPQVPESPWPIYTAEMAAPEPSPKEVLMLELINRFRADPIAEGARLATKPYPRDHYPGLDMELFVTEMNELTPAQPLVFHTRLVGASRNHLAYTLAARDYGHDETAGPPQFTGEWPQARAKFAGYPSGLGQVGECTGAYIHGGILGGIWAYIVDDGPGGDHGMQAGRGHRMALIANRYREIGVGAIAHPDGRWGDSLLCSPGGDIRLIGGVAYFDLDGDKFYDIGEGVGGLRIEVVKGAATRSWDSGAYRLEAGSDGKLQLCASLLDLLVSGSAPATHDNYKFDVELLQPVRDHLQKLRDAAGRRESAKQRRATFDLAVWTATVPKIASEFELSKELTTELSALLERRARVLAELTAGRCDDLGLKAAAKEYRGSLMESWYDQARGLAKLMQGRIALQGSRGSFSTKKRAKAKALKAAHKIESELTFEELRALFLAELALLRSIEID